jgi:hypothetical protein
MLRQIISAIEDLRMSLFLTEYLLPRLLFLVLSVHQERDAVSKTRVKKQVR